MLPKFRVHLLMSKNKMIKKLRRVKLMSKKIRKIQSKLMRKIRLLNQNKILTMNKMKHKITVKKLQQMKMQILLKTILLQNLLKNLKMMIAV